MFQFRSNGLAKSRLDCFLISREWYDSWEDSSQHVLVRNISDHCLILLKVTSINWGPKPFRVLNCWCKEKSFIKLVHEEWNAIEVKGCGAYVLKEKIKKLKEKINRLNLRSTLVFAFLWFKFYRFALESCFLLILGSISF